MYGQRAHLTAWSSKPEHGHAIQVNHLLELGDRSQGNDKYEAIDKWSKQLNALHSTVINKLQC